MIKLIASDLDGTLLHNGAQKLTPRAIELIHELTQKGVHFVAASGRQYDNERRLFSEIKDEISYIGENGSICIHQGKVISRGIIADDLACRIIDEVKKSPNFDILISREDACLIEDNHEAFVNHIVNVMQNTTKIVDDLSKIEGPFLKIAICNMIDDTKVIMQYLEHLQEMFGAEIKVVTSGENGSICIHQGKVISRGIIADDLACRIIDEVKKSPNFDILISREDACLIEDNHEAFVNHIVNVMQNTTKIVDDLSKIEGPFLKIAICNMIDDTKVIMQYLEHLQEMFGAEIKVVTSGNIWIDFIAPGTNKGAALSNLMKLFHVKPEECMAFGDQYNDLEMLELVGHSYAMSNSAPGVSYYADEVTDSVEDVLEDVLASLDK